MCCVCRRVLLCVAVWCLLYACCMFAGFGLSVYLCVALVRVVFFVVFSGLCVLLRVCFMCCVCCMCVVCVFVLVCCCFVLV